MLRFYNEFIKWINFEKLLYEINYVKKLSLILKLDFFIDVGKN